MGLAVNPDHVRHLTPRQLKFYLRAWFSTDLGEQICKRLHKKRWTHVDLAERSGVSKRRIIQILRGATFTHEELSDIAHALGCFADIELKPLGFRPRRSNKSKGIPCIPVEPGETARG